MSVGDVLSRLAGRPFRATVMTSDSHIAAGSSEGVILDVIEGPHEGLKFEFREHASLLAGRAREAHLCLDGDPHFSRYHFRIEVKPPRGMLFDLDSRNGTFVNGKRVAEVLLQPGDIISGGKTKIRFTAVTADPQATTAMLPESSSPSPAGPTVITSQDGSPATSGAPSGFAGALPQQIDQYLLHEMLGQGGMGVVHRATHVESGREVALKIIIPVSSRDLSSKVLKQLFLREAQVMSQLDHPRIVKLHQLGADAGRLFMAMEYVPSLHYDDLAGTQPPEAQVRIACGVVSQVLGALDFAHSRGFVHRDIKPGNILLFRRGHRVHSKLADFGIAKSVLAAGLSSMTGEGEMRGSLPYMSPEQVMDCRLARPSCDIYSAGVTLYWYLSRHYPFTRETIHSYTAAILNETPTPLSQYRPDLPRELVALVHQALQKLPDERFRTAQEMREALLPFSRRKK